MTITHGGRPAQVTVPRQRTAAEDRDKAQRSPAQLKTAQLNTTQPKTAPRGTTQRRAVPRVRLGPQIAIIAAAVAVYFLVRGATEAAYPEALRNALALVDLERALGIYWEPALQDALVDSARVRTALNAVYIYGHWPVIVVSLLFLARSRPEIYLRARNAMLISGGIGMVVFVSFPVAPPRLAGLGMTDTVTVASDAYRVLQPPMFTNQYAAMPSLHVGWDLVIGLALFAALRRPLLRALALAMPVAMVVAVVLTANHYIVDAVAGAALTATCWVALGVRARRRERALNAAIPVSPAVTVSPAIPVSPAIAQLPHTPENLTPVSPAPAGQRLGAETYPLNGPNRWPVLTGSDGGGKDRR